MIEFSGVSKFYKTVIGVNDIDLTLEPGAYGLLGPNGSGKTTLINLITGQLSPSIGSVKVFGKAPTEDDSILRKIGLCPSVEPAYFNLSGFQWVKYLTQLHGYSPQEATERTEAVLERVGMTGAMHRVMSGYSLGMRQRCKLAQAMTHDPQLLILDEPFNGLDPVGRMEMTQYLNQWIADGKSVLLASHVLHEVEAIDPSFLLISGGRLLASGNPSEVRSLMIDCPNTLEISCDDGPALASLVISKLPIDKIEFGKSQNELTVATKHFADFARGFSELIRDNPIKVFQVSSSDESLQDLFTNLMRRHRGEI